jgi:hypothetical protein
MVVKMVVKKAAATCGDVTLQLPIRGPLSVAMSSRVMTSRKVDDLARRGDAE